MSRGALGRASVWLVVAACGCAGGGGEAASERRAVADAVLARTPAAPELLRAVGDQGDIAATGEAPANAAAVVRGLLAKPLGDDSVVAIALLNSSEVRAAFAELGIATADLERARLLANPLFTAAAKFFSGGTEIDLGLTQPFLDVLLRPLRTAVATADLAGAKAHLTRFLIGVAWGARRDLVRVRAAGQLVALHRRAVGTAEAAVELMTELHRAGNVTDPQLTAEEAALARARLDLADAELALDEAREQVNVRLGLWGADVAWTAEGTLGEEPLAELQLEDVERRAIANSLDLAANRAHVDAAAQRAGIASWEPWLSGTAFGAAAQRDDDDAGWGVGPQLQLPLPLFDGGAAAAAAGRAELTAALHRHTALAVEIRAAARRLRDRAVHLSERARFLREVAEPLQQRLVRERIRDYNAMQIGAFEVIVAKQQQLAAAREAILALRDAWLACLDLEQLLAGALDRERLAAVPIATSTAATGMGGAAAAAAGDH